MSSSSTSSKSLVVAEVAGYTDLFTSVKRAIGEDGLALLTREIRGLIEKALDQSGRKGELLSWTGDGGLIAFHKPLDASDFASTLQKEALGSEREILFRIGIATGEIENLGAELSGLPLMTAHRLSGVSPAGAVLIDDLTWDGLSEAQRGLYGSEFLVAGKSDEKLIKTFFRKMGEERGQTTPFYVRSISVENVKAIKKAKIQFSTEFAKATGWFVLAGGNGAGKSTFLHLIAAAAIREPAHSLLEGKGSWLRHEAPSAMARVSFLTPRGEHPGKISCQLNFTSAPTRISFSVSQSNGRRLDTGHLAAYGPFKRLAGGSTFAQDLAENDPARSRIATLFLEEAALSSTFEWLRDFDSRRNHDLIPNLVKALNSGLLPDGFSIASIDDDRVAVKTPTGPEIPLQAASDGIRCLVAMVLDIIRGLEQTYGAVQLFDGKVLDRGVVLIDEPDNHLHVLWQIRLASWMKEHFPGIQFIVTSHSPFVCVGADKIWRLDDERGNISPRELPESEMTAIWNGPVSAILESDAFRVFNTLSPQAQDKHREYLKLHQAALDGRRLSADQKTRLKTLEQEVLGPEIPSDPEFDRLFP